MRTSSAFIVIPDTQFYSCAYADTFVQQAEWIAGQAETGSVALALHTGDIVDANIATQWEVAAEAMHRLDGKVPYLMSPGNHDADQQRNTLLNSYFSPPDLSMDGCADVNFKDPGRLDNAYALVNLRGDPWLFLGLEFGPRDATLDWAAEVLGRFADVPAVIFTHAHLYRDDERYDRTRQPPQPYHPDNYRITEEQGINDGQDIWETLAVPFENVRLILSGHVIPDGTARSATTMPSGRVVHEVLTNYQLCDSCPCEEVRGGDGYLRVIELSEDKGSLQITTYSPTQDQYLTDSENSFELAL